METPLEPVTEKEDPCDSRDTPIRPRIVVEGTSFDLDRTRVRLVSECEVLSEVSESSPERRKGMLPSFLLCLTHLSVLRRRYQPSGTRKTPNGDKIFIGKRKETKGSQPSYFPSLTWSVLVENFAPRPNLLGEHGQRYRDTNMCICTKTPHRKRGHDWCTLTDIHSGTETPIPPSNPNGGSGIDVPSDGTSTVKIVRLR